MKPLLLSVTVALLTRIADMRPVIYSVTALLYLINVVVMSEMEGFIVGGDQANIERHPHSVFLAIKCHTKETVRNYACGGSIISQEIVLTAAHCLEDCLANTNVGAVVGTSYKRRKTTRYASKFCMHEHYDTKRISNDIALILLEKAIDFGPKVKKVALLPQLPDDVEATLAGWGLVNEATGAGTLFLKEAKQRIWQRNKCIQLLGELPLGTFCADSGYSINTKKMGYGARGDSGSALVVRDYIQVGLVSYKNLIKATSVIVYTDATYFYKWVVSTAKKLYCDIDLVNSVDCKT